MTPPPIPVILDTDIGSNIDDTWALALLLRSPELDVKLVVAATGNTKYRARLAAKFLDQSGRSDIPVGVGVVTEMNPHRVRQAAWIEDYALSDYPGRVQNDGVQAIIDTVMGSPVPVTLICIGPVSNIAEALRREPAIATNAIFVGMLGSFHLHHKTNHHLAMDDGQIPEFNVVNDIPGAQTVFRAPWRRAVITPLDSCGMIVLDGDRYQRLRQSDDPIMKMVMDNYDIWSFWDETSNPKTHSSVLFDVVAIYLAFNTNGLRMETHPMLVDDEGYTRIDPTGTPVEIGMGWYDLQRFLDFLTARLLDEDKQKQNAEVL